MSKGNTNNIPMPPGPGKWTIMLENGATIEAEIMGGFDDATIVKLSDESMGHIFHRSIVGMWQKKEDAEAANKGSE